MTQKFIRDIILITWDYCCLMCKSSITTIFLRIIQCTVPLTAAVTRNNILLPSTRYLATEVFKSLTDKKDRKLLAVLRVIADRRPQKVLEVLKLYEPFALDTPQLFVANGKHYQPTKSHVLTRLRLLNKPRSNFDQQLTTSPVQSVVGNR